MDNAVRGASPKVSSSSCVCAQSEEVVAPSRDFVRIGPFCAGVSTVEQLKTQASQRHATSLVGFPQQVNQALGGKGPQEEEEDSLG